MFKKENICYFITGIALTILAVGVMWFINVNKHLVVFFSQSNGDHTELLALEKYLNDRGILVIPSQAPTTPGTPQK